jgi:osmotically-inducible protein OsmY
MPINNQEAALDEHAPDAEVSQISDEITHALHHSWFFDPQTITVTEEGGKVRLTGTVGSPHDRRRAAVAAWSHPGVTDVVNDIQVA